MYAPYKMVLVNLVASSLLVLGVLIYRYILHKKISNYFILLLLICSLQCVNIFRPGIYESGDFTIHIYRSIAFYESLREGIVMPSWAGILNATYGYPLFIFNYPLPYYLICFFHFIGFSFIVSMKLFLVANIYLSAVGMYIFAKKLFTNSLAALTSAIFYIFAPYYLVDIHFKIVIGEILFFSILPFTFYFFLLVITEKNKIAIYTLLAGIFLSFLIMSHVAIALFAIGLLGTFCIFMLGKNHRYKRILNVVISNIIGLLISSYIWITPFFLTKYTLFHVYQSNTVFSIPLVQLLYAPWRFGFLFQGPHGEISLAIGYTQLATLLLGIITVTLYKNRKNTHIAYILFWVISSIIFIFLITPMADFIWLSIPFIKNVGNHRLLIVVVYTIAIIAGYLACIFNKKTKIIYGVIIITIVYTILNWGHRATIPSIDDQYLIARTWKSTSENEGHFYANSQWINPKKPWFSTLPKSPIEILKGNAEISPIERKTTLHHYHISSIGNSDFVENTLYFPGWKVYINGKEIPVDYKTTGLMKFSLKNGDYDVKILYNDFPIYSLLKNISMFSGIIATTLLIILFIQNFISTRFSSNNK